MKILILDIETAPNLAYVWQCYKANISPEQLVQPHEILCWSAKWYGEDRVFFNSSFHTSKVYMLGEIHQLLDEADAVVHYNGQKFDIPHLNRAFLLAGMPPPSPYKQIDLCTAVKNKFRFPINKLQEVVRELRMGDKVRHDGFDLWVRCMRGDMSAWEKMREYNCQDTRLTETLYDKLLPWLDGHPNYNLYRDEDKRVCPSCGSEHLQKRGFAYTVVSRFQRYWCVNCKAWSRGRVNMVGRDEANIGIRS